MTSGVAFSPDEVFQKKRTMIALLEEATHGTFTGVSDQVGISRQTLYNWLEDDAQFAVDMKKARASSGQTGVDHVESKLMDAINSGNVTAMIFYLKCMGKDRNWIDQFMMSFDKQNPLQVTVTHDASREFRQMLSALAQ